MEIRVLRYYLALCREESIVGASKSIHISQPSLSRQLAELEEEVGKPLFIRGKKGIVLTEEGMLLRKRAEEIVALVDKTEEEFLDGDGDIVGRVDFGGGESASLSLIFEAEKEVKEKHPGIAFSYISGDSADIKDGLDKGLYDFALLYGQVDDSRYEVVGLPNPDVVGVLVLEDSEFGKQDSITLDELLKNPLIISRNQENNGLIREMFRHRKYNKVANYNLFYSASLMVKAGLGIAIGIDGIISTKGSGLKFLPITPKITMELKLVRSKAKPLSKAARVFESVLEKNMNR